METFTEAQISTAILDAYHEKCRRALVTDVVVVGAGPSGLTAAWKLASNGLCVVVLEKRLSPGGGMWGGSMGMNEVVVQSEALALVDAVGARHHAHGSLATIDALELASALCLKVLQAGATVLNLIGAEDVCVRDGRVTGVVANRSLIGESFPVDPVVFTAQAVIDATGHEAVIANSLGRRGHLKGDVLASRGEGPMDARAGEAFVVDHVRQVFPGLWVAGMAVCATQRGPRMGPIFGGMLLSGLRAAELVGDELGKLVQERPSDRFEAHEEEHCQCFPRGRILRQWRECSAARGILSAGLVLFVGALAAGQMGPTEWNWLRVTLLLVSGIAFFIVVTVPDHFLEEHLWRHVAMKHVPRIFAWTLGALIAMYVLTEQLELEETIREGKWLVLLVAGLVGLIPESGPHLIFATLYAQGSVPLSVLLASSIVQDGHGMLPVLAHSKRAFLGVKLVNLVVGMLIGLVAMAVGY